MRLHSPERRKLARFRLAVLAQVQLSGTDNVIFAETHDVSANGMYFHSHVELQCGQEVECVLILPEELTLTSAPLFVRCKGRILRSEKDAGGKKFGTAIEIHSYDFSSIKQPLSPDPTLDPIDAAV